MIAVHIDPAAHERREPPWDELDAGIRDLVRALWRAGFTPVDSGDGSRTGDKADMECALDVPHVFMTCDPAALVAEADRLQALIASWGVPERSEDGEPNTHANYAPIDGIGLLALYRITDAMLPAAARSGS